MACKYLESPTNLWLKQHNHLLDSLLPWCLWCNTRRSQNSNSQFSSVVHGLPKLTNFAEYCNSRSVMRISMLQKCFRLRESQRHFVYVCKWLLVSNDKKHNLFWYHTKVVRVTCMPIQNEFYLPVVTSWTNICCQNVAMYNTKHSRRRKCES